MAGADFSLRSYPLALRRLIRRAQLALYLRRALPAAAPALVLALLWVALALFDVWSELPGWAYGLGFILIPGQACLWLLLRRQSLAWPRLGEAARALEQSAGLSHQPLLTFADRPAIAPGAVQVFWALHQARIAHDLKAIKPLSWMLPHGRRMAVGSVLVAALLGLGLWTAGPDAGARLSLHLFPKIDLPTGAQTGFDLWVNPPAYTGEAPRQYRDADSLSGLRVPTGSELALSVRGGGQPALARWNGAPLDLGAGQTYKMTLQEGGRLLLFAGSKNLVDLNIEIIPDAPPSILWASMPTPGRDGQLRLPIASQDDHRPVEFFLRLTRPERGETRLLPIPAPPVQGTAANGAVEIDLNDDFWSGLRVDAALLVKDDLGQEGVSPAVTLMLPEKRFRNLLARQLITERKTLLRNPFMAAEVKTSLEQITAEPASFGGDVTVALGLAVATARLGHGGPVEADSTAMLLFDIALRLDGGADRRQAERSLEQAWKALQEALQKGADPETLSDLMEALGQAMAEWLDQLTQDALQQGQLAPPNATDQALDALDLMDWLRNAQRLAEQGDRQSFQGMMEQLRSLMENLRSARIAPPNPPESARNQALADLGPLMRDQQALMDHSGERGQQQTDQPRSGNRADRGAGELGQQQEGLRRRLGDMMQGLGQGAGQVPQPFAGADEAMRRARDALGRGDYPAAVEAQNDALNALREGAQALAQGQNNAPQFGFGAPSGESGQSQPGQTQQNLPQQGQQRMGQGQRDPLGRNSGLRDNGDGTRVEGTGPLTQSRDLIEELRRRAADPNRSPEERRYIERLLRRF